MARTSRLKITGDITYYHIISHTVWEAHLPFTDYDKEVFIRLLKELSRAYLVEVISYAIMSNHFHLLIKSIPAAFFSDGEILERAEKIFSPVALKARKISYWREKLGDISSFVKDLKGRFAQWYNRRYNRNGHLWADRFKSILIEDGRAAIAVSAYIDLNPVRAGLSKTISGYKFISYTARISGEKWLSPIEEISGGMDLKQYRLLLESAGSVEMEGKASVRKHENFPDQLRTIFTYRVKGLVFGSRFFVENILYRISSGLYKPRRKPTKIGTDLYMA